MRGGESYAKKVHVCFALCAARFATVLKWTLANLSAISHLVYDVFALPVAFSLFSFNLLVAFTCAFLGYAAFGFAGALLGIFGSYSWVFWVVARNEYRKVQIFRKTGGCDNDCKFISRDRMEQLLKELRRAKRV